MAEHYNAVIIGSGPAGSSCAKALKDEDIDRVLVLDQNKLPRYKCCSGVLFGQTLELLEEYHGGLPPDDVYCVPKHIDASGIQRWAEHRGTFEYPWETDKDSKSFTRDYLNIWRDKFDYWMLQESQAEVKDRSSFRGYKREGDDITVQARTGTDSQEFRTAYLVGADGTSSSVRGAFDPAYDQRLHEMIVHQEYFRVADKGSLRKDRWQVYLGLDGTGICAVHHKDERLTVCVGGPKGFGNTRQ